MQKKKRHYHVFVIMQYPQRGVIAHKNTSKNQNKASPLDRLLMSLF